MNYSAETRNGEGSSTAKRDVQGTSRVYTTYISPLFLVSLENRSYYYTFPVHTIFLDVYATVSRSKIGKITRDIGLPCSKFTALHEIFIIVTNITKA